MDEGDAYTELRPLLFSIAYRMVGSVSEAEDIVQEAFLRFHRATSDGAEVERPKAYLSAVTTRLAIDHLRSARVRRERYVGAWLPEPLLTDPEADAAEHAEGATVTLERNDRYWGTRAHLDRIVIRLVPDSDAEIDALRNGEADLINPNPTNDLVNHIRQLPGVRSQASGSSCASRPSPATHGARPKPYCSRPSSPTPASN